MFAELASAGLSALGNYFSARDAREGQESANNANIGLAREQMAFQERMARNAHQYEVEDLRKAGLNPILSAKYGGSATPPGSSPVIHSTESESSQIKAGTAKLISDVLLNKASAGKADADAALAAEMVKTQKSQQMANAATVAAMQDDIADAEADANYRKSLPGRVGSWVRNISGDVGGAVLGAFGIGGVAKQIASRGSRVVKGFSN